MKEVWRQLKARREDVAGHRFFAWLNDEAVPLERRFAFAPVMVDFIMGFADMNKWFLSYAEPSNEFERSINVHTEEDRTHSRLFYEDWYTLELGTADSWGAGQTLWWLFRSSDSAHVRRFGMEILGLAARHPEALVRFAMIEAIEVCGDVFFEQTAPIATRLSERDGAAHRYFGQYHRARETGHLQADEGSFVKAALSTLQRQSASRAVDRVFDNFMLVLDEVLSFAERAVTGSAALELALLDEYRSDLERGDEASINVTRLGRRGPPAGSVADASQRALASQLQTRTERLRQHALVQWLRDADTSAKRKLQGMVALWGIDIVGYRDFNECVLRYAAPQSELEYAVNDKTEQLAEHGALYLRDWQELGLDDVLGWDAGQTVAFYFLSEQTEVHRRNMAKLKKLAFTHDDAVSRSWLLYALESAGEVLFEATAPIARQLEQEQGLQLDYWANRHERVHGLRGRSFDELPFLAEPVSAEGQQVIGNIIDTIFENMEEQFSLSYDSGVRQVFVAAPATLPPPRESGFVSKMNEDALQLEEVG